MAKQARRNLGGLEKSSKPNSGATINAPVDGGGMQGDDHESEGRTAEPERSAESSGIPILNPIELESPSGEPRRRRGRPKGSTKGPVQVSPDLTDTSGLIVGAHLFLAGLLNVPELEIDEQEAELFSRKAQKLLSLYVVKLDERKVAWGEFLLALGGIYGPRVVAVYKRSSSRPAPVAAPTPIRPQPQQQTAPAPPPSPSSIFGHQGDTGGESFAGA